MTNTYDYSSENALFTTMAQGLLEEMLTHPEVQTGVKKLHAQRQLKKSDIALGIANLEYTH
jgi:hypothetical protein